MTTISGEAVKKIIKGALLAKHVDPEVAEHVAGGLVSASLRGVDSHGIRLIHHYLAALEAGRINPAPKYRIEKQKPSVAVLDADDTFGHAAGMEAARLAVEMARECGSGHVAVKNSTHFGAAAYFALEVAAHDMIGMSFTHSDSLIIPTHGKRSFLGNNPICFTAPVEGEGPFCLDMATSIITFNEVRRLREIGGTAPDGVGADKDGRPTTNPEDITMLMPVGSYKGYGLSLMIEILCSTLTGMPFGPNISKMFVDLEKKRHLGHFVSAMDISAFIDVDTFKARLKQMLDALRSEPALDAEEPVMVAGDPEKKCESVRLRESIPVSGQELARFQELNSRYDLKVEL